MRPLLAVEFSADAALFKQVGDPSRLISVDESRERDEEQLAFTTTQAGLAGSFTDPILFQ